MKIKVGICGLPNIGKSTLFNALARKSVAQAENYPFCTIEPNIAPITVPDKYLLELGTLAKSEKAIPAVMEFIDVAGLVAGASRGEGLGNRFLATIRECNAICHLIRYFEDPDIIHVDGRVSPKDDAEVVNLELVLADTAHIERRLEKTTCRGEERLALEKLLLELQKGIPARAVGLTPDEEFSIKSMGLLTLKPVIYVFNVDEADFLLARDDVLASARDIFNNIQYCDPGRDMYTVVSAKVEAAVSALDDPNTQKEYFKSLGVELEAGEALEELMSYSVLPNMLLKLLDLFIVYTGPGVPPERSKTLKSHLFSKISTPTTIQLAGRLHGEIERGFIRAEVIPAPLLLQFESYNDAKETGTVRTEGKDCILEDNDVVLIKWK